MKVLDLFCGRGGWSKGFEGMAEEIVGVDIKDLGYPYDFILQDVRDLNGFRFKGFDVIVGSPPCRDFSRRLVHPRKTRWKIPPDPRRGLGLVYAFLARVLEAQPRYWMMENVIGLQDHLDMEPVVQGAAFGKGMKRNLYGSFPAFLVPYHNGRIYHMDTRDSAKRAEIPYPVARAFAEVTI